MTTQGATSEAASSEEAGQMRGQMGGQTGGQIVWFTGLPASGKSTLAHRVHEHLARAGRPAVVLDSDELREVLGAHSYATEGRDRFYRALAALAGLVARQGVVVLVAATAPRRRDRDRARTVAGRFVEVWVQTPLAECEVRDPKGLYAQARRGEMSDLPGVGTEYEPPTLPEVTADGGLDDAAVEAVASQLEVAGSRRSDR